MKWWICNVLLLLACTNHTATQAIDQDNDSTTNVHAGAVDTIARSSIALQDGCYEMIMKRDTANLSLHIQDTVITGELNYRWAEKDWNQGTIKGHVQDSLLVADYTFESEGLTSVREVIFKLRGDTLLEGSGALMEQNGKVIFKQKDHLQYNQTFPFIRVNCQELHH